MTITNDEKVYICAPLGGNVDKNLKISRYTRYALMCGAAPVVPHFYALCLNDRNPKEREIGMTAGLSLLWFCDEMWIFGDEETEGMKSEIQFCKSFNIRTRKIKNSEIRKKIGGNIRRAARRPMQDRTAGTMAVMRAIRVPEVRNC